MLEMFNKSKFLVSYILLTVIRYYVTEEKPLYLWWMTLWQTDIGLILEKTHTHNSIPQQVQWTEIQVNPVSSGGPLASGQQG